MRTFLAHVARMMRRNRGLTGVMVLGLASGVTLWQLSSLTWREQRETAVGDAPSLFAIVLHRDLGAQETYANNPALRFLLDTLLAERDAAALIRRDLASRVVQTAAGSLLAAGPDGAEPEEGPVRFSSAGLFEVFGLKFRFGGPYRDGSAEIVLDDDLNRRWFGGRNSVGENVRIGARLFRVAGVLAPDRGMRIYDVFVPRREGLFLPFEMFRELRVWPDAAMATDDPGRIFSHPDAAEDPLIRVWLEVPENARAPYERFLEAHVRDGAGRLPALVSARLLPWSEWRRVTCRGEPVYDVFRAMGILILAGCSLNLVRIAMVLLGARSHELGIRRAMGASRRLILRRQLGDAAAVGTCAGIVGIVVLLGFVPFFNAIIPIRPVTFFVDARAAIGCLLGGPIAAVLAAFYPAWKFSRLTPAALLRRQ